MAIQNNPITLGGMSTDQLLDLLYRMMLIRAFEDKAAELYNKGGKMGDSCTCIQGKKPSPSDSSPAWPRRIS